MLESSETLLLVEILFVLMEARLVAFYFSIPNQLEDFTETENFIEVLHDIQTSWYNFWLSTPACTCSESTMESLELCSKPVQS